MYPLLEIETARLRLRKLLPEDESDVFEIFSNEQTCLDGSGAHAFTARDDTFSDVFRKMQQQGKYAVVLKQEEKCIGILNLREKDRAVPTYELGFVLNANYRRNGYIFEAAENLISTYFSQTDVEIFTAGHFPKNNASSALLRKLGFTYEGTIHKAKNHAVYGATDLVYYYKEKEHQ